MKLSVTVKPGSKKGPLVEIDESDGLVVYVREQAIEGKANKAVVELLAKHYGIPKSLVEVVGGHTSRHKIVNIESI